jgi:hypothetical protein
VIVLKYFCVFFSKLLQQLDLAAQDDALSVDEAVLDKGAFLLLCQARIINALQFLLCCHIPGYMLQLVEVQQHRGAEGGDIFCSLLSNEPINKSPGKNVYASAQSFFSD